jgi:hypothetical protein
MEPEGYYCVNKSKLLNHIMARMNPVFILPFSTEDSDLEKPIVA